MIGKNTPKKYETRQRQYLRDFLRAHVDEQLSVNEIYEALKDSGLSRSAIYRNLAALEKEGRIYKHSRAGSRQTLYRYSDEFVCGGALHMCCRKCGRTFHMAPEHADEIVKYVIKREHFVIDVEDTIVYGTCEDCY